MIYQILGWPRSRTAWLANFLTYGNSFCFHEGMAYIKENRLRSVIEYRNLFKLYQKKYKHVGDSNTVALLRQKYVIPGARVVIIEKERQELENSLLAMGYYIKIPDVIEYPYNEHIVIKFDEISDNLEEIWKFCLPGEKFSRERELLLKNLNVQVHDIKRYLDIKDV